MHYILHRFALDPKPQEFTLDDTNITYGDTSIPLSTIHKVTWYESLLTQSGLRQKHSFVIEVHNTFGRSIIIHMHAFTHTIGLSERMQEQYHAITRELERMVVVPQTISLKAKLSDKAQHVAMCSATLQGIVIPKTYMLSRRAQLLSWESLRMQRNEKYAEVWVGSSIVARLSYATVYNLPLLETLCTFL